MLLQRHRANARSNYKSVAIYSNAAETLSEVLFVAGCNFVEVQGPHLQPLLPPAPPQHSISLTSLPFRDSNGRALIAASANRGALIE